MAEAENGEQGKNPGEEVTAPAGSDQGSGLAPRPIDSSISAIVGVGASAGGLEALEELFRNMPTGTGMAFIVVTHLHPGHKSLLPELLTRITELPVVVASHGLQVQADHIYVGPPGGQLSILDGRLRRQEVDASSAPRMPIDYFFRALARDQRERAICIILSGTGTDGTLGLREIKGESGMVMVEQAQSAKYAGMPTSAAATGLADFVLPPAEMPRQLVAFIRAPYLREGTAIASENQVPVEPMQEIFQLLRNHTGHDFSSYKMNTIHRRIARRMSLHQIEHHDQYVRYLRETPGEIDLLFKELLINVTNFFRDPEAWESLQLKVEELVQSLNDGSALRVWVPACSSGEEVYSIAILLHEIVESSKKYLEVQVFGTDLDAQAIDRARTGRYPEGISDDISQERLKKFFIKEEGIYRIRTEIRDLTVFATQNVIKDPPFTRLNIISCRNMLIYLNAQIQKKLLPLFHYALKPEGLLFLGTSETVGTFTDLFEPVDKRWKIFRRKKSIVDQRELPDFPLQSVAHPAHPGKLLEQRPQIKDRSASRAIERALLQHFVPACVIVNHRGDIVYVHGRTGAYLEPSEGQPRNNVLEMAREGLQFELAEAIRESAKAGEDVVRNGIRISTDGVSNYVDLTVSAFDHPEALRELLLVVFRPAAAAPADTPQTQPDHQNHDRIEQLERALKLMRETQQATLEDLESSNEEFESTNEELQSTNEELQSTNEELETSKEEMQSLNEELTTVNAELLSKVEELSQANADMQNLLNSTKIATIFLDNDLKIKRFTDQARELVMLRPADIDRPISELASRLQRADLTQDCRQVLGTLVFTEEEVQTEDGEYYLMRIMPYRTANNSIDGLVLTFVNISRLRQTEKELHQMSEIFREGADPAIVLDMSNRITQLNDSGELIFGYSREEMLGKPIQSFVAPEQVENTLSLLNKCRDGETIKDHEWTSQTKTGDEQTLLLSLTLLRPAQDEGDAIAMTAKPSTPGKPPV